MTVALTRYPECIRFYSGYNYSKKVHQLFNKLQQATSWFDNPPEKIGRTAYEIDKELLPSDEVEYLDLDTKNAKRQLDLATARLSYIACLICQCVQGIVFHFMNIRLLNQNIASLFRTLRDRKGQFMSSPGFRIGEKEIGKQKCDLFVLTLPNSTEVIITLKSPAQSAFLVVDVQQAQHVEIKQIRSTDDPNFQQAIGQIACELINRQENASWIFCHTGHATLSQAGFYRVPNSEGLWKRRESGSLLQDPILPGEGPFLPIRQSASS